MSKLKTHYAIPFTGGLKRKLGICNEYSFKITDDYRKASCLKCISAMNPGEQMWHDKNNQVWIEHKLNDGRRK